MFQGFTDRTFEFLMAIRFNNNREFFLANHDWYEHDVRTPCLDLAEALNDAVEAIDPSLERRPHKVVSRINRDVRFSNDKSPYRDYLWLAFRRPGEERHSTLGVYVDISDQAIHYGMGFYDENKPLMKAHRAQLVKDSSEFGLIARDIEPRFQLFANAYKRMPIPESIPEPLKKWYPLRGFYVEAEVNDDDVIRSSALVDVISDGYRSLKPMYDYFTGLTPIED